MDNAFPARIKQREKYYKNKAKNCLADVLDFITVAFIYEEETYNKFMNKVDKLRGRN